MRKLDCGINTYTANFMIGAYDWVSNATAECIEDFNPWDIIFTAITTCGGWKEKFLEVKSLKYPFQFKYDGQWNNYFSTDNPEGIIKKMKFGNTPPADMDILDVPHHWEPEIFTPETSELPKEWEGKHIYFLNAEDKYHRVYNSKTYKMFEKNVSLCYAAHDGFIFFNPSTLRKAFLGYAWYLNKSHSEYYDKKYEPVWELKACFDLSLGVYHNVEVPKEYL